MSVFFPRQMEKYDNLSSLFNLISSTTNQATLFDTIRDLRCSCKAVYTLTILPDARTVRERFAAGCPCTHCVHCVGFVRYTETTSGGVRSGRERFAAAWLSSVNARVNASNASGRK